MPRKAPMAFAQNIDRYRRGHIHPRLSGHGRCVRPGCVAVELPSPSTCRNRAQSDTSANGKRHAIAEPKRAVRRRSRRSRDGHTSGDGPRSSEGAAIGSSSCDAHGYPPDGHTDGHPAAYGDPHRDSNADR
jgi:hypothetical protein